MCIFLSGHTHTARDCCKDFKTISSTTTSTFHLKCSQIYNLLSRSIFSAKRPVSLLFTTRSDSIILWQQWLDSYTPRGDATNDLDISLISLKFISTDKRNIVLRRHVSSTQWSVTDNGFIVIITVLLVDSEVVKRYGYL